MTTFNYTTASLSQLKAFADEHGINPNGDRRRLETWKEAIAQFLETAQPIAEDVAHATIGTVTAVYEVATSEQAVEIYKETAQLVWFGSKFAALRFARFIVWVFRMALWMADAINNGFDMAVHVYDHPEATKASAKTVAGLVAYELACVASQFAEDSLMQFMGWAEDLGASAREEMAIAWFALNEAVAEANQ